MKSKFWRSSKAMILVVLAVIAIAAAGCGGGGSGSTGSTVPTGNFPDNPQNPEDLLVTCTPSPSWEVLIQSVSPATGTNYIVANSGNLLATVSVTAKNTGDVPLGSNLSLLPDNTATPTVSVNSSQNPSSVAVGASGTWQTQVLLPAGIATYKKCFFLGTTSGTDNICAVGSAACWTFQVQ